MVQFIKRTCCICVYVTSLMYKNLYNSSSVFSSANCIAKQSFSSLGLIVITASIPSNLCGCEAKLMQKCKQLLTTEQVSTSAHIKRSIFTAEASYFHDNCAEAELFFKLNCSNYINVFANF